MRAAPAAALIVGLIALSAQAQNIVSKITAAPINATGLLRDAPSGTNIFLQRPDAPGDLFLDPAVIGYGLPPGGAMEVEMIEGFERDPSVPLNARSILLVAGTPQQAITSAGAGYRVEEGVNPNVFLITATRPDGMPAETLRAAAPGAARDHIPQRGIKIIHIGRQFAFRNRGRLGVIAVRIFDRDGAVTAAGRATVDFDAAPQPAIFPTNIPDGRRNRNWQHVAPGHVLGATPGTLPLSLLLFDPTGGDAKAGIAGAGVLSAAQLTERGFTPAAPFDVFEAGLILQDRNGDGLLDPAVDRIIGGVSQRVPSGGQGAFPTTPLVDGRPLLAQPTARIDPQVGARIGGSVMDVLFQVGDATGDYAVLFALMKDFDDPNAGVGARYVYHVKAK